LAGSATGAGTAGVVPAGVALPTLLLLDVLPPGLAQPMAMENAASAAIPSGAPAWEYGEIITAEMEVWGRDSTARRVVGEQVWRARQPCR
jgi:hypothetical protein